MRVTDPDPAIVQEYQDYLYGQNQDGWFHKTGNWWYGLHEIAHPLGYDNYATQLNAEIFWKIRDALPDDNPFDAPEGEVVDAVIIVYLTSGTPFEPGVDGRPKVYLNAGNMRSESSYFDDLSFGGGGVYSYFIGTIQIEYTLGGVPPTDPALQAIASSFSTLHEIFHNFSLWDGPPNLAYEEMQNHPERHYYYGYLNLMCQHMVGLQGIPGVGLPWLAQMEADGWVEVVDFSGQNLKNETIYDIRSLDPSDPQAPRGKIYKFPHPVEDEYFLISYHGGTGIDAQDLDDDGIPMVKANGLEIYHCVGNTMFDIESAFGTYSNINLTSFPADVESLDPATFLPTWGTEDRSTGRDNYDYWESSGQPRTDFATHPGYVFDFFSKDLGNFSQWEKEEFSFRSNPNTYWYQSHTPPAGEPAVMLRTNPQDAPNSMVVRIREQHNDAQVPYAVVDFLSAPYEEVLSPGQVASETYFYGHPMSITWEDYFGNDISQVEIFFSPQNGAEGTYELLGQVDTATEGHAFEWIPNHITDAGKIKLVFHNSIDPANTCDEESEHAFNIHAPVPDVVSPNGGEYLVFDQTLTIEWETDESSPGGIINLVDLYFDKGDGNPETTIATGIDASLGQYSWTPATSDATENGIIRIVFHNTVDPAHVGEDVSDDVFTVIGDVTPVPVINSTSEYPIIAGSADATTVISVKVTHPNPYPDMIVKMDATSMGGESEIDLLDNGEWPDLEDDDGIYTSGFLDINAGAGISTVGVFAYASFAHGGNGSYSEQIVDVVVEETGLKLVDGSAATGDLVSTMQGNPFANTYYGTGPSGSSVDVLVISKDSSSDSPDVYKRGTISGGVPRMDNQLTNWFSGIDLPTGGRGLCAADFDNDGDEDLLVCNNSSNTKLYQNTGTEYSDVTSTKFSSAGITALNGSHVAAWGDYNQDGWIDLFVASMTYSGDMSDIGANPPPASPVWSLFRNNGSGFEKTSVVLTDTSGVPFSPTQNALSATWNDIDGDNDLDLLVGYIHGINEENPQVFENQGPTKFTGDFQLHCKSNDKGIADLSVNSMDWIDYNHDIYPDLVVTAFPSQAGAIILENVVDSGPEGGRKFVVGHELTTSGQWEGASVGDLDQNGEEDVVLLPHSGIPAVYLADPASPSSPFKERAYTLGLKPTSGQTPAFTSGAVVADFNDDHDLDLFLGRPKVDQFLYRNMRQDGIDDSPAALNQNWIDIDLATWGNSNNSLIGSKVTVIEPNSGKTWFKMVDGGSGRGGQNPNQLHFGLGEVSGPVDVLVEWPSGGSTSPPGRLTVNSTHLITEESVPTIYSPSLVFSHEPFPGGADWVFAWNTVHKGDIREDKVSFQYEPGFSGTRACTINVNRVLTWDDSDVEMSVSPIPGGWRHRVVWKGKFCSAYETCHFQFQATSGVSGHLNQSTWKNFGYFDTCIDDIPLPQN